MIVESFKVRPTEDRWVQQRDCCDWLNSNLGLAWVPHYNSLSSHRMIFWADAGLIA